MFQNNPSVKKKSKEKLQNILGWVKMKTHWKIGGMPPNFSLGGCLKHTEKKHPVKWAQSLPRKRKSKKENKKDENENE
jgi:hypothetical protein